MSDAPLMLGVSGLRGIVGKSLTPEVAARYAAVFGGWIREQYGAAGGLRGGAKGPLVVIGADGRRGWQEVHDAAVHGLTGAGCDVVDLGVAMTPTVGVIADHMNAAGAMIVTASHNPQEWNGLKCLVRAAPRVARVETKSAIIAETIAAPGADASAPDAACAAEIVERFRAAEGSTASGGGARPYAEAARVHVDRVTTEAGRDAVRAIRARRVRVLLDSVNGAGRVGGRKLLAEALGCELIHHGAEDSGLFPHPPEPTKENLVSLCSAVTKFGAQVGFAQDPDADRLAIVDEQGQYIGEEYTLALAAEALLGERHEGTKARRHEGQAVLVANLSTSRMIDDVAAKHGARVVRTPVGEANVVEAMKREAAAGHHVVLGGEGNGGVIWPRVTYVRDSLSGMALVLALMARTGKTISRLVAEIPAYAIEKRKVDLARREDAAPAIAKLRAFYSPAHAGAPRGDASGRPRIDLQDGIRLDWDGPLPGGGRGKAWLHVRASNTEPIMRLIAEAPTAAAARAILDEAARVIGA